MHFLKEEMKIYGCCYYCNKKYILFSSVALEVLALELQSDLWNTINNIGEGEKKSWWEAQLYSHMCLTICL